MFDLAKTRLIDRATRAATRTAVIQMELGESLHGLLGEVSRGTSPSELVLGLEKYRNKMLASLEKLECANHVQLSWSWHAFMICYNDYVEAIRQTKCEIAYEDQYTCSAIKVADEVQTIYESANEAHHTE